MTVERSSGGEELTAVQRTMLTGPFYIDGWHNTRFLGEANELAERGLLTMRDGSDDQRTVYHFEPASQNPQLS